MNDANNKEGFIPLAEFHQLMSNGKWKRSKKLPKGAVVQVQEKDDKITVTITVRMELNRKQ